MKMDGVGEDADMLLDEDDSARFVVARNITSSSSISHNGSSTLQGRLPSATGSATGSGQFSRGRRNTHITTQTGEFANTESENKRSSKSTGMSDRKQQSTPERIAHFYYTLGLLCSSHPVLILVITTTVVTLSW